MPDLTKLQSTLTELLRAVDSVGEDFARSSLKIATELMKGAIGSDLVTLHSARVNDLSFVLRDVSAAAGELTGSDAGTIAPLVATLESEMRLLEAATALPADVLAAMQRLIAKLSARRAAVERQTYVEGTPPALPHPPEELRGDALPLREQLASAGFPTPALDSLIADPQSATFQSMRDIIDELEAVGGL